MVGAGNAPPRRDSGRWFKSPQRSENVPVAHFPRRPGGSAAGRAVRKGLCPPYRQVRRFFLVKVGNAPPRRGSGRWFKSPRVPLPCSGPGTVRTGTDLVAGQSCLSTKPVVKIEHMFYMSVYYHSYSVMSILNFSFAVDRRRQTGYDTAVRK